MKRFVRNSIHSLLTASLCIVATAASADLNIAEHPLFLGKSAEPNIMFILDDSGSMLWSYLPDSIDKSSGNRRQSHLYNNQYYNPEISYRPPPKGDGTYYPNVSFTNAPTDGFNSNISDAWGCGSIFNPCNANYSGRTLVDLSKEFRATWNHKQYSTGTAGPHFIGDTGRAHYYKLLKDRTIGGRTCKDESNWSRDECWEKVEINEKEEQNFANWYSYYRTRELAARSGIGIAFNQLDEDLRVGFGAINKGLTSVDGENHRTIISGVRKFSGNNRASFFNNLYGRNASGGTPLRRALDDAGQYFSRTDNQGPWGNSPGDSSDTTKHLECRQSATVLMTDGYWNGASARDIISGSNIDNIDGPTIKGPGGRSYQYKPTPPYQDSYENTLADVAMYYWNRDLRSDLVNAVPTSTRNPAFWQHMRTYTVALGLDGTKDSNTPLEEIDEDFWPKPVADKETALDDLWHAAINGRGGFFSASDPDTFANELNSMLSELVEEARRAAAAVSTNSTQIEEGSLLYQASMQSGSWKGELTAFEIDPETNKVKTQPAWEAGALIDPEEHAERKIYTFDSDEKEGIEFTWNKLSDTQKAHLSEDLVDYLRGDQSNEGTGEGKFRARASLLGDIVNSSPEYVGGRNYMLHLLPGTEGSSYPAWLNSTKNRADTIYVGSNNGMLHAFDAASGAERFAYVPNSIIPKLPRLAEKDYQHTFFVDGSPKAMDVDLNNNGNWKTVLVGSTGAGGNSVFALDVSDPANPEVLWEFTHDELGYRVQQPTIARLKNDDWVAVFGNGYNSNSKTAQLFLVSLATGNARVIDTEIGSKSSPNGLADPAPVDLNGDRITDVIYAGDYHGNMYKFDLSKMKTDDTLSSAEITVSTLYEAVEGSNQPITSRPEISGHPDPGAVMVFFGTGQYFLEGDDVIGTSPAVQAFYGIVDSNKTTSIKQNDLLKQTILSEDSKKFGDHTYHIRTISQEKNTAKEDGWYLELQVDKQSATGERVVSTPTVQGGRVRFLTFTPSEDPCGGGGGNWLMEVDALTGALFHEKIWDLSGDGTFDSVGGGVQLGEGPPAGLSRSLNTDDGPNQLFIDPKERAIGVDDALTGAGAGRQSWRELN